MIKVKHGYRKDTKIPQDLEEMTLEYFNTDGRYASKLWIHLMAFHIKKIAEAYITQDFFANVMQYISKHYTLRFQTPEHLQEIHQLFPNEKVEEIASTEARYLKISKMMTNLLEDSAKTESFLTHQFPQDQIQTAIEIEYIKKHIDFDEIECIVEIGAGYGRIPELLIEDGSIKKYIIVDIPPALWISKTYLKNRFPDLKTAEYCRGLDKAKLKNSIETNQVIFISPSQMSCLPSELSTLAIAINCLQEMPQDTVKQYFENLSFIAKYFYIKAQKNPHNPWSDSFLNFEQYLKNNHWTVKYQDTVQFPSHYKEGLLESCKWEQHDAPFRMKE